MCNALKYSLKIWLTSVLVSPGVHFLGLYLSQQVDISGVRNNAIWIFKEYIFLVVFQLIFSSVTWFVFCLMIALITRFLKHRFLQTILIFAIGIILTISTFYLTLPDVEMVNRLNTLMYANCFGIGCGVWYYKLT